MDSLQSLREHRFTAGQDFFQRTEVQTLIRELSKTPALTIFLGAGASVAHGLPTWNELLLRMLVAESKQDNRFANDEERDQWARLILRSLDSTAAASVLKSRIKTKSAFAEALHAGLYQKDHGSNVRDRGSEKFSQAVIELIIWRKRAGLETSLLTLNFDDNLERVFDASLSSKTNAADCGIQRLVPVHSAESLASISTGDFPVFHLHGYLPKDHWEANRSADFILSSADFATQWDDNWTSPVLRKLMGHQWLMAGMSFQDTHVTSLLRKRLETPNPGPTPIGILSTQGRPWRSLIPKTVELLAEAEQTRLHELGMTAIVTSYFFQDYTFLLEVANQTRDSSIPHYHRRRTTWDKEFLRPRRGGRRSVADQREKAIRRSLTALRNEIEAMRGPAGLNERVKAELWIRDVQTRSMRLAASSELRVTDSSRAPTFPLEADSNMAAVRALTNGSPRTFQRPESEVGSWRSFVGFPIGLPDSPWWDLPVATVVVASTNELFASVLARDGTDVNSAVQSRLTEWATLLNPRKRLPRLAEYGITRALDS